MGILNIAPHVALVVRYSKHGAQRASALDLQGEGGAILFQHVAQHGGSQQRAAQGGCGNRKEGVDLSGPLYQVPAGDRHGLDQAVSGNGSYQFVAHKKNSP